MNNITNNEHDTIISGTSGNDSIINYGSNVQIYPYDGDNNIENSGDHAVIFGGGGNDTIRNSGENALILGGSGKNVIISENGNSTLIGGTDSNTLTGGTGANVFVHQNGANDVITNYNQLEDVIILASGKVSESLASENGNDIILKIADDNGDLGTITVKEAYNSGHSLTIYEEDYINRCKEVMLEFSNAYITSVVKTFKENEDVQSILTDGENSAVLAEIKAVDSELAEQIAEALKRSYESGVAYLESSIANNSSLVPMMTWLLRQATQLQRVTTFMVPWILSTK